MRSEITVWMAGMILLGACQSLKITDGPDPDVSGKGKASAGIVFRLGTEEIRGELAVPGFKGNGLDLDTNEFHLSVYAVSGEKVYDGKYGKRPAELKVIPGAYDVSIASSEFTGPGFDAPQFGDYCTILAEQDQTVCTELKCRQLNAGLILECDENVRKRYPGTGLYVRDSLGAQVYPYHETRAMYVHPGACRIEYSEGGKDTVLYMRHLHERQMFRLRLSCSSGAASSFRLQIDTLREWNWSAYDVGYYLPDGTVYVEFIKRWIGFKNVSVYGYVLGGDATETTIRVGKPFSSKTHLVLAPGPRERDRNKCMAVELPAGKIRDELNLKDHPELLGTRLVVTGEIVDAYFGYPGMKKTKSYLFVK